MTFILTPERPPYYQNAPQPSPPGGGIVYVASLVSIGTADPVPTIIKNDIGPIVWTRTAAGIYQGTLTGAFPLNKIMITVTPAGYATGSAIGRHVDADTVLYGTIGAFLTPTDGETTLITIQKY